MDRDPRQRVRILALCPGPVAAGFFASLGDQAATNSIILIQRRAPFSGLAARRTGRRGQRWLRSLRLPHP
jgi:hypothetical protein